MSLIWWVSLYHSLFTEGNVHLCIYTFVFLWAVSDCI